MTAPTGPDTLEPSVTQTNTPGLLPESTRETDPIGAATSVVASVPSETPEVVPTLPVTNTITLINTAKTKYETIVRDNTLIDATNWMSAAIGPEPEGTTSRAVDIYGTNPGGGGANITWRGGVIVGSIPLSWSWRTTHDFGGAGILLFNSGPVEWQYLRIHNVEDGIKPREAPEYSNTASWRLRDCYFTAIRDDAIENDRFEPGAVRDCLFDGVYTFLSEQDENVEDNSPIGPDEEDTITIERVYVRLYGTNGDEGPGVWFKLLGDVPHHKLVVRNSVFAIGSEPRLGWKDETIPPEVTWAGEDNFILWLGEPGAYGGETPAGVTFLEGEAARDKWVTVRNRWLTEHGLPAEGFPADYNPHEAPVMQIPVFP